LADQIRYHFDNGDIACAELLRQEGLDLAKHGDDYDYEFMVIQDQTFSN
jgi:hypothetical protein